MYIMYVYKDVRYIHTYNNIMTCFAYCLFKAVLPDIPPKLSCISRCCLLNHEKWWT